MTNTSDPSETQKNPSAPAASAGSETQVIPPRHVFRTLPEYKAGKPPKTVEGLRQFKLSSNENPLGPIPAVREAMRSFTAPNTYPDPLSTRLRTALSAELDVPADDIVTGAGSYGALSQIISTFAGQGEDGVQDEVIYAWRSFEAYPIIVGLGGAKAVQVPLTEDSRHDLPAMLKAITERTKVIILCTPNNPTGPALTQQEVEWFLQQVPREIVVVLDEAYYEFCRESELTEQEREQGGLAEGISLYRQHPHLVVLRTFSKAAGLAGLRVGYSIAHQNITRSLRVSAIPFAVSTLAESCAVAALEHQEEILEQVRWIIGERERVATTLREQGWEVPQTRANFVWLPLGERSADFATLAGENALSVRAFPDEGVRVSIGEEEANDRFLRLCEQFGA